MAARRCMQRAPTMALEKADTGPQRAVLHEGNTGGTEADKSFMSAGVNDDRGGRQRQEEPSEPSPLDRSNSLNLNQPIRTLSKGTLDSIIGAEMRESFDTPVGGANELRGGERRPSWPRLTRMGSGLVENWGKNSLAPSDSAVGQVLGISGVLPRLSSGKLSNTINEVNDAASPANGGEELAASAEKSLGAAKRERTEEGAEEGGTTGRRRTGSDADALLARPMLRSRSGSGSFDAMNVSMNDWLKEMNGSLTKAVDFSTLTDLENDQLQAELMRRVNANPVFTSNVVKTMNDMDDEAKAQAKPTSEAPKPAAAVQEVSLEDEEERKKRKAGRRLCCVNCGRHSTPQWRAGPAGPKTLCNACGVKFRKLGKL